MIRGKLFFFIWFSLPVCYNVCLSQTFAHKTGTIWVRNTKLHLKDDHNTLPITSLVSRSLLVGHKDILMVVDGACLS